MRPHRRGPRRERTIDNSRTRVNGIYYSNKRKGIQDITPRNRTTNCVSGEEGQNYRARSGYRTIGC
jgi:hypothetical protein